MVSAWNGHLQATKLLLEQGADVALKNVNDETCLHIAAQRNYAMVVEEIIAHIPPNSSAHQRALLLDARDDKVGGFG